MTIPSKPGLEASTDQALAEARECRRTPAAKFLIPFSDEIVAILKTQFPGIDPVAWRALMSAVQSAVTMHLALELAGRKLAGHITLSALALAAEQLDRESGDVPEPASEDAQAIAREVTRLRGLGAESYDTVLNAFELLLRFHSPSATQAEITAILTALTGQVKTEG
jgi:hypothetical protein